MDESFRTHESDSQQPRGIFASLQFFHGIIQWLAGFIRFTEEEQNDAGVYLDEQHYK